MKCKLLPAAIGLAGLALVSTSAMSATAAECGGASWYAIRNTTANGEMMNPDAMTAAHRTLPFGTVLKVKNEKKWPRNNRAHQ